MGTMETRSDAANPTRHVATFSTQFQISVRYVEQMLLELHQFSFLKSNASK